MPDCVVFTRYISYVCFTGYGITTDGTTKFINASTCSINYKPTQRPIVFDIKLPAGVTKRNYNEQTVEIVYGEVLSEDSPPSGITHSDLQVAIVKLLTGRVLSISNYTFSINTILQSLKLEIDTINVKFIFQEVTDKMKEVTALHCENFCDTKTNKD